MQVIPTFDKKFIFKEIDKIEKYELLNFCNKYFEYLKINKQSLMAKIFGMFSIKLQNQNKKYYILM